MLFAEIITNKPLLCFTVSVEKVHISQDVVRTELLVPWHVPLQFMLTQRRLCTSLDVRMVVSIGNLFFSVSLSFTLLQPVVLCCLVTCENLFLVTPCLDRWYGFFILAVCIVYI